MTIHYWEVEELAEAICGLPEGTDSDTTEQMLYDKFEISFESFGKLIEALAPMTPAAVSPLTGDAFSGFARGGAFIVKVRHNAPA
jgi:hypothetical protein